MEAFKPEATLENPKYQLDNIIKLKEQQAVELVM